MDNQPKTTSEQASAAEKRGNEGAQERFSSRWRRFMAGGSFFEAEAHEAEKKDKKEKDDTKRHGKLGAFMRKLAAKHEAATKPPKTEATQSPDMIYLRQSEQNDELLEKALPEHQPDVAQLKPFEMPALGSTERPDAPATKDEVADEEETKDQDKDEATLRLRRPHGPAGAEPPEKPPTNPFAGLADRMPEPPTTPPWEAELYHGGGANGGGMSGGGEHNPGGVPSGIRPEMVPLGRHERRNVWGPAIVTGLIADILSRRRDRKLRREDRKLHKEDKRLEQEVYQLNNRLHKAEVLQAESLVRLPERPQPVVPERPVVTVERPVPWMSQPKAETLTPVRPAEQVVASQKSSPEKVADASKRLERLSMAEAHHLKPEEIFNEVRKAAKDKLPVESLYERRHERKDEAQSAVPAAPLGGSATSNWQAGLPPAPGPSSYRELDTSLQTDRAARSTRSTEDNPLYVQAIKAGFIVALIVVFLIVVWLVLT